MLLLQLAGHSMLQSGGPSVHVNVGGIPACCMIYGIIRAAFGLLIRAVWHQLFWMTLQGLMHTGDSCMALVASTAYQSVLQLLLSVWRLLKVKLHLCLMGLVQV
jgi:hypothetical protein